jgi:squalene cyclase
VRDHKKYFRHDSVGGWPFSTADHGWPITDCTAEGLKTALLVEPRTKNKKQDNRHTRYKTEDTRQEIQISDARLKQGGRPFTFYANDKRRWLGSYELTRAPEWLELLNPSEVFGNIMVDYSYTECSPRPAYKAWQNLKRHFPDYRSQEIETVLLSKGIRITFFRSSGKMVVGMVRGRFVLPTAPGLQLRR